jgi:beta-lactamase regulating signal transducer with metallopeptidase domain
MQILIEYPPLASLLKASGQAAVLILLVLAAQWAFGRRLSPRWRYGLWLLVLIRLALPWTIPSGASVFNLVRFSGGSWWAHGRASSSDPGLAAVQPTAGAQKEIPNQATALQPPVWARRLGTGGSWLLAIWSAGALALAGYVLATHYRLWKRVTRQRPMIDAPVISLLEDCKQQMGIRVPVVLVETREVGSPSLFGFIRPRVLLPAGLTQNFSLAELRHVFLHELGHIKRRDIMAGWLMTALQIVHWFNPLVWLAFHRMRVDRELACDALALSYAQEGENQRYGQTIIKLLERFGRSAWTPSLAGAVENHNQMKERINMIAKFKKTNHGLALAVALFAGLGLVTLTDAQSGTSQPAKDLIGTWIMVGSPGQVGPVPAAGGRIKQITDRTFSVTQTDPENGEAIVSHSGSYTLKGNDYAETVERAGQTTAELVKQTFKFTIKIEGDTLTQTGIGNPWTEVWKRTKSDAVKPKKLATASLLGKWTGKEIGGKAGGTASLVVEGSNFEFHGGDTNEWYKAAFSEYDTTPKQLVIKISACPFPEYVGRTSYAIYELKDGGLTIAGNEPGNPCVPGNFDAAGSRKLVFKQE